MFVSVIMTEVVAGEMHSRSVNTAGILCSQGAFLYYITQL
jgi:hypothetical protein